MWIAIRQRRIAVNRDEKRTLDDPWIRHTKLLEDWEPSQKLVARFISSDVLTSRYRRARNHTTANMTVSQVGFVTRDRLQSRTNSILL